MSKRITTKPPVTPKTRRKSTKPLSRFYGDDVLPLEFAIGDGEHCSPIHLNPETEEEREKRLAARKALTLKAFQATYENRRR